MKLNLGSLMKWSSAIIFIFIGLVLSSGCTCSKRTEVENTLYVDLQPGGVLKGMDPAYANDVYAHEVISQINETLLHYNYLKRPLALQPLLAESMPEVSEDGLTHTFKIKKGVLFHDSEAFPEGKGRELIAEDFVYSFKRIADPEVVSDGFWIFDGKIKGLNEWREKLSKGEGKFDDPVEGLQAPDKYTLVIKLARPYYQLHYVLAMSYATVVPREAVEKYGKEYLNHPVGTGPFMFSSWTRGNRVELLRNPNFREELYPSEGEPEDQERGLLKDAGKKLPFVDKLVIYEIVEDQPRWLSFMKGNTDATSIPKDNYDSAIANGELLPELKDKGIQLWKVREQDLTYVAFNMLDPLLGKNVHIRRAMSLAYDMEKVIEIFYNGRAILAASPIPPDVDAFDSNFKNPWREFNIEKAKEELKLAGYPGGKGLPSFEYIVTTSSTARQMGEHFQQNMKEIGIDIKLKTLSWPQFTQALREKKGQVWGIAWQADYPDAENFLQLLYGPNTSPGPNAANFQNDEFDNLYDMAAHTAPGEKRTEIYKKMRDIFVENMPWIPSTHRIRYYVYHPWLKNYKRHNMVMDWYKYLRVDQDVKKVQKAKL